MIHLWAVSLLTPRMPDDERGANKLAAQAWVLRSAQDDRKGEIDFEDTPKLTAPIARSLAALRIPE
jgi:hypothetical protein